MSTLVHQLWGLCPADAGREAPPNLDRASRTWQHLPGTTYKRWNRNDVEALIDTTPWKDTFYRLDHWVEQCDFARYIIVYTYGGIYSDMDTVCHRCPTVTRHTLTVGYEARVTDAERAFHNLARNTQYCQWTFAADKGHPALLRVIDAIHTTTSRTCASILNRTGPGVFTDALCDYSSLLYPMIVLGIEAFGCGQQHSESPSATDPRCLVVHNFEGSWKYPPFVRSVMRWIL